MDPARLELILSEVKHIERRVRLVKQQIASAIEENDDLQPMEAQDDGSKTEQE